MLADLKIPGPLEYISHLSTAVDLFKHSNLPFNAAALISNSGHDRLVSKELWRLP
jgi:hypothetical protein